MNIDKVKEKIRLLLNVAKNEASTDGEIDNAMRFAASMMAAYHLDESEIKEVHIDVKKDIRLYGHGVSIASWESYLAGFVRDFVGSIGVYIDLNKQSSINTGVQFQNGRVKHGQSIVFYGSSEEVEFAKELFSDLSHMIAAMAKLKFGTFLRKEGRSYADGFVAGLRSKLKVETEKLSLGDQQTRTLIVQSQAIALRKQEEAKQWLLEQKGLKLKGKKQHSTRHYSGAYSQGHEDGKRTELDKFRAKPKLES